MHSMHYVISYRASFKPELPQFFIERYSNPGDLVLDPFGGRGTTTLQANLMGRLGAHNDINPVSTRIAYAKSLPFSVAEIEARLKEFKLDKRVALPGPDLDLLAFYHKNTLKELINLRKAIAARPDDLSRYIELVALSRLHGHSDGFFSVYTFPQISVPVQAQRRINKKRKQKPLYREVAPRILKKAKQIIKSGKLEHIRNLGRNNVYTVTTLSAGGSFRPGDLQRDLAVGVGVGHVGKGDGQGDEQVGRHHPGEQQPAPLKRGAQQQPQHQEW